MGCAPQKLDLAGLIALSSLTELCTTGFSDSGFEIVPFCDSLFFPLLAPDNSLIRSLIIPCSDLRLKLGVTAGDWLWARVSEE